MQGWQMPYHDHACLRVISANFVESRCYAYPQEDRMSRVASSSAVSLVRGVRGVRGLVACAVSVTIGLVAACGSDSPVTPSGDAGGGGGSVAAACERKYQAQYGRCPNLTPLAPDTIASFHTRSVDDCTAEASLPGAKLDASLIAGCAVALESAPCGTIPEYVPECQVGPGTLPKDSPCNVSSQCASGYCDSSRSANTSCGICRETLKAGDSCATDGEPCPRYYQCGGGLAMTCQPLAYVAAGVSCDDVVVFCFPSAVCDTQGCVTRLGVGMMGCLRDEACVDEAYCDSSGTCVARGKEGDACSSTKPCLPEFGCDKGSQKCAALMFLGEGAPCDAPNGVNACQVGGCGEGTGALTCAAIVEDGAGCLEGAHTVCRPPATCRNRKCATSTSESCK